MCHVFSTCAIVLMMMECVVVFILSAMGIVVSAANTSIREVSGCKYEPWYALVFIGIVMMIQYIFSGIKRAFCKKIITFNNENGGQTTVEIIPESFVDRMLFVLVVGMYIWILLAYYSLSDECEAMYDDSDELFLEVMYGHIIMLYVLIGTFVWFAFCAACNVAIGP